MSTKLYFLTPGGETGWRGSIEQFPDRSIEITPEQHGEVIAAKIAGREALVVEDELVIRDPAPSPEHEWIDGEWVLPEPVEPETSEADLWAALRAERDGRLMATDWLVQRHAEELALGLDTTLTPEQHTDLLTYRQALRDLPENTADPADPVWPVNPVG